MEAAASRQKFSRQNEILLLVFGFWHLNTSIQMSPKFIFLFVWFFLFYLYDTLREKCDKLLHLLPKNNKVIVENIKV